MSILESVVAARTPAAVATPAKADRVPTQFWLNVGVTLKGQGPDGADLFVSLPVGIALDDMKPVAIKGSSKSFIELQQTKNALLAATQAKAGTLSPGERCAVPEFTVEIARVSAPEQNGTVASNGLMAALMDQLSAK